MKVIIITQVRTGLRALGLKIINYQNNLCRLKKITQIKAYWQILFESSMSSSQSSHTSKIVSISILNPFLWVFHWMNRLKKATTYNITTRGSHCLPLCWLYGYILRINWQMSTFAACTYITIPCYNNAINFARSGFPNICNRLQDS